MGAENCLTLSDAKIKELPDNFYASIAIGDMYVHIIHLSIVYVEKKEGCGRRCGSATPIPNLKLVSCSAAPGS